jgi:hypothetical protein
MSLKSFEVFCNESKKIFNKYKDAGSGQDSHDLYISQYRDGFFYWQHNEDLERESQLHQIIENEERRTQEGLPACDFDQLAKKLKEKYDYEKIKKISNTLKDCVYDPTEEKIESLWEEFYEKRIDISQESLKVFLLENARVDFGQTKGLIRFSPKRFEEFRNGLPDFWKPSCALEDVQRKFQKLFDETISQIKEDEAREKKGISLEVSTKLQQFKDSEEKPLGESTCSLSDLWDALFAQGVDVSKEALETFMKDL